MNEDELVWNMSKEVDFDTFCLIGYILRKYGTNKTT